MKNPPLPRLAGINRLISWSGIALGPRPAGIVLGLGLAGAAAVMGRAASAQGSEAGAFPRNVILIVPDALRADVLGTYGGEARTPYIDSLSRSGVTFLNAFSTSSWTGPSSVSMLTANYPTSYPVVDLQVDNRTARTQRVAGADILPAEILSSAGFTTASYVENKLLTVNNVLQGFSTFVESANLKRLARKFVSESTVPVPLAGKKTPYRVADYLIGLGEPERFFMLVWFIDPHSPYRPPPAYIEDLDFDSTMLPRPPQFYTNIAGRRLAAKADSLSDLEAEYLKALYIGEVESIDRRIGFLLGILRAMGLLDDTVIILTSDHGEAFGEQGNFSHGHKDFPNVLCHVPLIIAGPGVPSGKSVAHPVSNVGLAPTILDLLGIESRGLTDGRSFRDLVYEDSPDRGGIDSSPLFLVDANDSEFAMIDGDYKLVISPGDTALCSISRDPDDENNVAADHPDIVNQLLALSGPIRERNLERRVELERKPPPPAESDSLETGIRDALKSLGYIH